MNIQKLVFSVGLLLTSCVSEQPWIMGKCSEDGPDQELRWVENCDQIQVLVHPTALPWFSHIQEAVTQWNAHGPYFRLHDPYPSAKRFWTAAHGVPKVVMVFATHDPGLQNRAVTTWFASEVNGECRTDHQQVRFPQFWMTPNVAERIAVHEFGHVLGLDHDDDENSVMYYKALNGPYQINEKHLRALCRVYGYCP